MAVFCELGDFMTIQELANKLDKIISPDLSEPWDNDGRMVIPNPDEEVTRVLCTLDCTSHSIEMAKNSGCNVIVTHHPLIFKPVGAVNYADSVGKRIVECIKSGIAVLSYHTRLDIMEGGVNDMLCGLLGIKNAQAFIPYGRIGDVDKQPFEEFAKKVVSALKIGKNEPALVKSSATVKRVAVVSGCGKDEIKDVIAAGADTFVTGEVMHSHMIDCKELGLNLICGTHYATERFISWKLGEIIRSLGLNTDIYDFTKEEEYGI